MATQLLRHLFLKMTRTERLYKYIFIFHFTLFFFVEFIPIGICLGRKMQNCHPEQQNKSILDSTLLRLILFRTKNNNKKK